MASESLVLKPSFAPPAPPFARKPAAPPAEPAPTPAPESVSNPANVIAGRQTSTPANPKRSDSAPRARIGSIIHDGAEMARNSWISSSQMSLRSGLQEKPAARPKTPRGEAATSATPHTERWAHLKRDVEAKVTEQTPQRLRFDEPQSKRTPGGAVQRGRHPRVDPFSSSLAGSALLPKGAEAVPTEMWTPASTCPRPLPGDLAAYRLEQMGSASRRGFERDPILDGEEHTERPQRKRSTGTPILTLAIHEGEDDLTLAQKRMLRAKPEYKDDCAGVRTDKVRDDRRIKRSAAPPVTHEDTRLYNRKFTPLSHLTNPRDPILQEAPEFDASLARAESLRVFREKLHDRYDDQRNEERDLFRLSPEKRPRTPSELYTQRTGERLFGEAAIDEAAVAHGLRTAVPRPPGHDDVLKYRHSGGICPDDYAIADRRGERGEYEERLQDLARIKLEVDHVYNVIRARAEKTSKALREFLYDKASAARANAALRSISP
eukprot:tig00001537_g9298.t1